MNIQFPPHMLVGTSSWSSQDWCGTFYPKSIEPADMIRVYFNNHYAGYAPGSVELFAKLFRDESASTSFRTSRIIQTQGEDPTLEGHWKPE